MGVCKSKTKNDLPGNKVKPKVRYSTKRKGDSWDDYDQDQEVQAQSVRNTNRSKVNDNNDKNLNIAVMPPPDKDMDRYGTNSNHKSTAGNLEGIPLNKTIDNIKELNHDQENDQNSSKDCDCDNILERDHKPTIENVRLTSKFLEMVKNEFNYIDFKQTGRIYKGDFLVLTESVDTQGITKDELFEFLDLYFENSEDWKNFDELYEILLPRCF